LSILIRIPLILFCFLIFSHCFGGVDNRGSVLKYNQGFVYTEGGKFRIGVPSGEWEKKSLRFRAIVFAHQARSATLSVDSFCKGSFDDAPLTSLADQLFYGMAKTQTIKHQDLKLEGRAAVKAQATGTVDGAPIRMEVVVLKMNACVFDFVYMATPEDFERDLDDFKRMYEGFHYLAGPPID